MVKFWKIWRKKIPSLKFNRGLKIAAGVILIGLFLYLSRSLIFAAWVNFRPIFRLSLIRELEKQGGKSVIESLIEKSLVYQEASRKKVKITDQVIDQEIVKIETLIKAQGLNLDDFLSFRGQKRNDLIEQIRFQKTVENLLSDRILVSEEEIKQFFEKNKNFYEKGTTLEKVKNQIRDQLFQTKLVEEYQKWIKELKTKAKIFYFVKY